MAGGESDRPALHGVSFVLVPADDETFRSRVAAAARSLGPRPTGLDLQRALRAWYPDAVVRPAGPLPSMTGSALRYVYRDGDPPRQRDGEPPGT